MDARDFQYTDSGNKYYEQLVTGARTDAENVAGFFQRRALYYLAARELPALEELRAQQAQLMDTLSAQIKDLDERIATAKPKDLQALQFERGKLDARFDNARKALPHIEQALRAVIKIEQPQPPAWLLDWLREFVQSS